MTTTYDRRRDAIKRELGDAGSATLGQGWTGEHGIRVTLEQALAKTFPDVKLESESGFVSGLFKVDLNDELLLWVGADGKELASSRLNRGVLLAVLPNESPFASWDDVPLERRVNLPWPPPVDAIVKFLTPFRPRATKKG